MSEVKRRRRIVALCLMAGVLAGSAGWWLTRGSAIDAAGGLPGARSGSPATPPLEARANDGRAEALERPGDPRGLDGLRERFAAESNAVLREESLRSAASLGTPEAVAWLAQVARGGDPLASRAGAALGTVADAEAASALAALLAAEGSVLVRANAARALGASGGIAYEKQLSDLVADGAEALRVRQESARSLGRLGARGSVPRLASILAGTRPDGTEEQLRLALVEALAELGGPDAIRALKDFAGGALTDVEEAHVARSLLAMQK